MCSQGKEVMGNYPYMLCMSKLTLAWCITQWLGPPAVLQLKEFQTMRKTSLYNHEKSVAYIIPCAHKSIGAIILANILIGRQVICVFFDLLPMNLAFLLCVEIEYRFTHLL